MLFHNESYFIDLRKDHLQKSCVKDSPKTYLNNRYY